MPGRIAGISSLFIDGVPITAQGDIEYQPMSTKRTPIMAGDGSLAGYKEEGEAPYISFTAIATGAARASLLFALTNVLIVARLANGITVTGHSMTQMDAVPVKNDDATFAMKYIGPSVIEV